MVSEKYSNKSIIGFVLSLSFMIPLASLVGFIISIIAFRELKKTKEEGKGLAIAGMIIGGILGFIQFVGALGFLIVFIYSMF